MAAAGAAPTDASRMIPMPTEQGTYTVHPRIRYPREHGSPGPPSFGGSVTQALVTIWWRAMQNHAGCRCTHSSVTPLAHPPVLSGPGQVLPDQLISPLLLLGRERPVAPCCPTEGFEDDARNSPEARRMKGGSTALR